MYQDLIVNDLLIYVGTLLVAAAMFAFIALCFLGCLLVAIAARALQLAALKLAGAVHRQWAGWRIAGGGLIGQDAGRYGEGSEPAGLPVSAPTTEAIGLAEH